MINIPFFGRVMLAAMTALTINLLAPATGLAQQGPIVKDVDVRFEGPATVSEERILANIGTTIGQPYSDVRVEEDIRNLYLSGDINNARIFKENVAGGVKVTVIVQTKPVIGDIILEGNKKFSTRRLRKEMQMEPGQALNDEQLELDRQAIVAYYNTKGFSEIDVQYKVDVDETRGTATITYAIFEGQVSDVRRIDFEGNDSIPAKELRALLTTKPKTLISFFTKTGTFTDAQLENDAGLIREEFQNRGFIEAQVIDIRIERVNDKKVDVVFVIEEGPQYRVESLKFVDNTVFNEEELRTRLRMVEGEVYSPKLMREDLKAMRDMYGVLGYVDFVVIPEGFSAGPALVDVVYNFQEGEPSTIEFINIEGNTRTKDKVLRRELAVKPGDVYNTVLVDASKTRLEGLGYFSRVEAVPTDTGIPGTKDLNVYVDEQKTGSFNFGLGFSSIDSLIGFAELTQSNFDLFNYPSFIGAGQRFRARAQYGAERSDFIVSLTEPWFLGYQISLGGELYFREADFFSDFYSQRNYGGAINASYPIAQFMSVGLEYRLENIDIYDIQLFASPVILASAGNRVRSAMTASYLYDTRDSLELTRSGSLIQFSPFVAGGFLGGDVDIYGMRLEGTQYFNLPWDVILILNGELATVDNWDNGSFVPVYDRIYLGGANDLRGFDFRDVGPKDIFGEPIGGKTMMRMTIEMTFPIIERIRGAVFYDGGFVQRGSYDFSTSGYNDDVGIGLRLDLPIGPIRIDYGYPLNHDRWNGGSGKFNFNVGYQF